MQTYFFTTFWHGCPQIGVRGGTCPLLPLMANGVMEKTRGAARYDIGRDRMTKKKRSENFLKEIFLKNFEQFLSPVENYKLLLQNFTVTIVFCPLLQKYLRCL